MASIEQICSCIENERIDYSFLVKKLADKSMYYSDGSVPKLQGYGIVAKEHLNSIIFSCFKKGLCRPYLPVANHHYGFVREDGVNITYDLKKSRMPDGSIRRYEDFTTLDILLRADNSLYLFDVRVITFKGMLERYAKHLGRARKVMSSISGDYGVVFAVPRNTFFPSFDWKSLGDAVIVSLPDTANKFINKVDSYRGRLGI